MQDTCVNWDVKVICALFFTLFLTGKVYQESDPLDIEISEVSVESDGNKSVFDLQDQTISHIKLQDNELTKCVEIIVWKYDLEDTFRFLPARARIFGSYGNAIALQNSGIDIFLDFSKSSLIAS